MIQYKFDTSSAKITLWYIAVRWTSRNVNIGRYGKIQQTRSRRKWFNTNSIHHQPKWVLFSLLKLSDATINWILLSVIHFLRLAVIAGKNFVIHMMNSMRLKKLAPQKRPMLPPKKRQIKMAQKVDFYASLSRHRWWMK